MQKKKGMAQKYITKKSEDYALLDRHTGEILDYNQTIKLDLRDFIMVFFASIPEIVKLDGQKLKVLAVCWMQSDLGKAVKGNVVHNNASFKEQVRMFSPNMSDSAIDGAFSYLVKHNMLRRVCRGEYELNHHYFFRGKLSDRSKLAFKIEVDPKTAKKAKNGSNYCFFTKSVEIVEINASEQPIKKEGTNEVKH